MDINVTASKHSKYRTIILVSIVINRLNYDSSWLTYSVFIELYLYLLVCPFLGVLSLFKGLIYH